MCVVCVLGWMFAGGGVLWVRMNGRKAGGALGKAASELTRQFRAARRGRKMCAEGDFGTKRWLEPPIESMIASPQHYKLKLH